MRCFRFSQLVCLLAIISAASLTLPSSSLATNLEWTNFSGDNNWNTNGSPNFRDGITNGVPFQSGDSVLFQDPTGFTVNIDAAGVSPSSMTVNRGYGISTTFNGGDILSGSLNFTRDDINVFTRDASYSFSGGTFLSNAPTVVYSPSSAGSYQFGTGAITASGGEFHFQPGAAATITNNIVLSGGGTVGKNANATFSGTLTIVGNTVTAPRNALFAFDTLPTFTQDMTLNLTRCCNDIPTTQFSSNVNGAGVYNFSVGNFNGNPDWTSKIAPSTNSWNVKNILKEGVGRVYFSGDTSNYFSGTVANGGAFILRSGSAMFDSSTVNVSYTMLFNPDPLFVGTGTQTGAGFNNVSTLNINTGGTLGGNGTVASDNNLNQAVIGPGGFVIGDFESAVNVFVSGGTIAPGMTTGTATLSVSGGVTFNANSTLRIDIANGVGGLTNDLLAVAGNVTGLNNVDLVVNLAGLSPTDLAGESFTILTAGNDLTTFSFHSIAFTGLSVDNYQVTYGNGFVQLSNLSIAVPEPSSVVLLGSLLIGAVGMRRRRGRK